MKAQHNDVYKYETAETPVQQYNSRRSEVIWDFARRNELRNILRRNTSGSSLFCYP